jgi:large subunit ribosomal protein L4e
MKASVFDLKGEKAKEIELPVVFETTFDPALIKRAVLAIESAKKQPKGKLPMSGRQNTALYRGARYLPTYARTINVEHARLPRLKNRRGLLFGKVAGVAHAVGGPAAHPPKVEKVLREKINKKERKLALASAIAASANLELVKKRGHNFSSKSLPIVLIDNFEELKKTKDVANTFEKIGILTDVERAKNNRQVRAGKGKKRGRKYKRRKSILVVTAKKTPAMKAARNLEGIDVVEARNLNSELLAPGTLAGRLVVYTEGAIKEISKNFETK